MFNKLSEVELTSSLKQQKYLHVYASAYTCIGTTVSQDTGSGSAVAEYPLAEFLCAVYQGRWFYMQCHNLVGLLKSWKLQGNTGTISENLFWIIIKKNGSK